MATATSTRTGGEPSALVPPVLPLENGDRLTREDFERRYEAMHLVKKAELLEGVVYMPSPVKHYDHSKPQFNLITWAGLYVIGTPGIEGGDNGSLKLDNQSQPQPDVYLIVQGPHGGQARIEGGYVVAAPDWIGEVAASTASYDLHVKLEIYQRHGVREYVVWRVLDKQIDWFVLRAGQFDKLAVSDDGLYRSEVFPGLWLDPRALIAADLPTLQSVVQRGLASPEHQQFVERLARHAAQQ